MLFVHHVFDHYAPAYLLWRSLGRFPFPSKLDELIRYSWLSGLADAFLAYGITIDPSSCEVNLLRLRLIQLTINEFERVPEAFLLVLATFFSSEPIVPPSIALAWLVFGPVAALSQRNSLVPG